MNRRRNVLLFAILCIFPLAEIHPISLDQTFATGGKFITTFSDTGAPSAAATRVFVQPSGRIVAVGSHTQQGATARRVGIALVGLTSTGALDTTFGVRGKMLIWNEAYSHYPSDIAMLDDGSILVLVQLDNSAPSNEPRVMKFTPTGQLDSGFDGRITVTANDTFPVRMAKSASGKIYAIVRNATTTQLNIVRLNADGSRDTDFGPNGVRSLRLNRFYQPTLALFVELEDGKLLIGGTNSDFDFNTFTFLVRLDADSNLDRSFGNQGVLRPSIAGGTIYIESFAAQPDGKLLLGGSWTFLGSTSLLMRLNPRGRLDATFGNRGTVQAFFNDWNVLSGIVRLPNGKLIAAGSCGDKALPSNARVLLVVYGAGGAQESFLVTNFVGTREAEASDIALQPDGKFVVAGYTQNPSDTNLQFAVARYQP